MNRKRQSVKRIAKNLTLLLACPLYLLYRLFSLAGNPDGAFQSFSQFLSLVPGKTGTYLRAAFYRLTCPDTSDEISIGFLTVLSHRNTTLRKGVYIGPQCNIGMCDIGENTLLGSGVHILSGSRQHDFSDSERPIQEQGGVFEKIEIGRDCWIGNNGIIMVPLANQTVVAAGSVVTKSSNPGDILAGNPAKKLRNRLSVSSMEQSSQGVE